MSTGEAWKSRSAGGIDTFNTSASLRRMIVRDEINCTLFGTTGLPTVGTWVRGDEFRGTDFIARHNGTAWVIVDGAPVIVDDMGDAHYNAATCRELIVFAKTRSEEHTSELQSLMRISYAVFCLNITTGHMTKSHADGKN